MKSKIAHLQMVQARHHANGWTFRIPRRRRSPGTPRRTALHKGAVLQLSGPGRAFKGLGVAKRYCRMDSIGDTLTQY